MAILHTEYLIFSALSYCVFGEKDIGKNIYALLEDENIVDRERILLKNKVFFAFDFLGSWNAIGTNLLEFLKKWDVVDLLDKTDDGESKTKTGFYGVVFGKKDSNNSYKELVIAYRGSQLFPMKEAYRDFVETDLKIGMGKKPKQFDDGLELYRKVIDKYDYKSVYLTGHSLGGGIAQYVAVISELFTKDREFIPKTVTFNGVGILIEGMLNIFDFLDYQSSQSLIENMGHANKWDKISKLIQQNFSKKIEFNKEDVKFSELELKSFYSQYFFSTGYSLKEDDIKKIAYSFLDNSNKEKYNLLKEILDSFKENKKYIGRVKNFVHSDDFTASFLPHVGRTVLIDKRLDERKNEVYKKFPINMKAFQKEMMNYHLFDMFIPYISVNYGGKNSEREFYFSNHLNFLYVAAVIRKLIYDEKFSKEFLILYYKNLRINFADLKDKLLKELNSIEEKFVYKNQIIDFIEDCDSVEIKNLWFEVVDRLVSPFEQKDIYDHILYVYNVRDLKNLFKQ